MKHYKKVLKDELDFITCDFCGKKSPYEFEGGSGRIEFGYGSKRDMEQFNFDVCDKCFDEKFKFLIDKIKSREMDWILG